MPGPANISLSEYEHLRERLENSQRIARIGDWEMDPSHRHLHWSDEIFSILDLPRGEGPPDSDRFYSLIHPDDLELVHREKRAVHIHPHKVQFEHRIVRLNGEVRHIQQRLEMVFDSEGLALRIVGTLQDITEQKNNEDQFFRGQRMETIGALASGIVHDLNNVLGPVHMATELLLEEATDPNAVRLLEMILRSAQRGTDLVKQILTFAKGTGGGRGVVQMKNLIQDMANVIGHTFPKNIHLETAIEPEIHTLIGDPVQIHQVLLNLCTNARDAMPEGGTLAVSVTQVKVDRTFAQMSAPEVVSGSYVLLSVKDSGKGMTPDIREHIFDLFYTTKAADGGTGLGLSTVRRIVEGHGGFILVHSGVGRGSEFKVYLPLHETDLAVGRAAEKPFAAAGRGELILIVDDEAAIRNIAQQLLEVSGYQVITASDGAQAIARAIEHASKLELMITDMSMPIMDGSEAIQAVRAIAPHIRIIAASGTDWKSRAASAGSPEADASLHKPYSADDLLKTVHAVLHSIGPL